MVQLDRLNDLSDRIAHDAQIFDDLLRLIPAKFYVSEKNDDENMHSKFQHNKRKKTPKQAIKEATKKAKKLKLDPENAKTITDIQTEKAQQLQQQQEKEEDSSDASDDDSGAMRNNDDDDQEMDVDSGAFSGMSDKDSVTTTTSINTATTTDTNGNGADSVDVQPMERSDISELRVRLQERINELRKKRNAANDTEKKARSRAEILAARNKKKEDRKKAIKAQKEKGNKAASEELVVPDHQKPAVDKSKPSADSIKMDGAVYFGKLAVGKEQPKKKGPSDAKTQLKMLEQKKEKIEKLKDEDKSKADQLLEKEEWNKVLSLATGEKPKDNVKLLKKTIKRQEKQKGKSAQEWNKRLDKVKMEEKKKIQKREENIKAKIEEKKNRKRGIKKPKARPGFEGIKRGKGGKVTKPTPPTHKHKK
ncbi:surfeit locus protein 6-domain-containing protein [Mycotypha africana]|uniref:surfeit locus protein 6-domain-containing protein n=1 Tax=Mycotypha africana TaxID=64632 RepID=UPI00230129FB|nr:surfeit locus protein 6-domain-containing protein [Mycotypha africana]KAI8992102.1 surfeit locus protein 6-domain-containing protein [Mycotypha africana]